MTGPLLPALFDPPDRVALRFSAARRGDAGTDELTYRELAAIATALVPKITGAKRVAVHATPTIHTAVAVVAALLAGIPAVPLNPKLGERERAHVLADAAPELVLAAPDVVLPDDLPRVDVNPAGPSAAAPGDLQRSDVDLAAHAVVPPDEPDAAAAALVIYTSGTTGPPKGAVLSRRAVAANLDALAAVWDWTADDLLAHALPLFHVHGLVLGVLGPLRRGGTVHHLGALDAAPLAASGAHLVFGVPTQYHRLADQLESDPAAAAAVGTARLLVSGSAALTATDHARLRAATGLAVRERYGMTETLILTAARASDEPEPGTVGPPLPGMDVRIVPLPDPRVGVADPGTVPGPYDAARRAAAGGLAGGDDVGRSAGDGAAAGDGRATSAGPSDDHDRAADGGAGDSDLGAVEVRGPSLFDGYLNRPDATAAATTTDGWFATGDIGRFTPSGALALVGRSGTDLIKSGGYKIGAGEIENALLEHPGVAEAAVVGVPDADLGERIVAHVVPAGAPPPAHELIDHVAALLAPHKRPREVRFTDALPRNDMGKVLKARLKD